MTTNPAGNIKSTHIYEIDLIRAITVFSVVAIHTLSYTNTLITDQAGFALANFIGHALHYNREMFMFVSGLVLTYVYFRKPLSKKSFWLKRFSVVLIPYILWTIIYVVINHPGISFLDYVKLSLWNTLTGDASFQLYYILLTLQFYAIFPWFLDFMKKVAKHPWKTLAISLVIQLVIIYIDFFYLQIGPFAKEKLVIAFVHFQDRIFLLYEFFFVLGAFGAIYLNQIQNFFAKFGKYFIIIFLLSLWAYAAYYYAQLYQWHFPIDAATSVLQPSVVLYSIVVIVFFSYLSYLWAKTKKGLSLVKIISDTSFGIYFVHVLAISLVVQFFLPLFTFMNIPLRILTVLLISFSASVIFSYMLLRIPFLSWTIGKFQQKKQSL